VSLDYAEVLCPRCGSLNRRFRGPSFLSGSYVWQCDHCGADLATGRFDRFAVANAIIRHGALFGACALLGAFVAIAFTALVGGIALGEDFYQRNRPAIMNAALAVGVIGGCIVAERNRRRGNALGARRVAAGTAEAKRALENPDPSSVQVVDLSPQERARVKAGAARGWCLGVGYAAGVLGGIALSYDSPVWREIGGGVGMIAGLLAGWLFGRWRFPDPR
jgi:hypothetical protein